MENLILFNEKRIIAGENIDYIQILQKHQRDDEKHLKVFEMVIWCCGFQKIQKLKRANSFSLDWSISSKESLDNNTIQLITLSNEGVALVNVNKLKAY